MATRSTISILYKDKTLKGIYCHWDGGLDYNGIILLKHYRKLKKIQRMIDLGGMSTLCKKIKKNIFYARDCGEDLKNHTFDTLEVYRNSKFMAEFNYIYDEEKEKWFILEDELESLEEKISKLEKTD